MFLASLSAISPAERAEAETRRRLVFLPLCVAAPAALRRQGPCKSKVCGRATHAQALAATGQQRGHRGGTRIDCTAQRGLYGGALPWRRLGRHANDGAVYVYWRGKHAARERFALNPENGPARYFVAAAHAATTVSFSEVGPGRFGTKGTARTR